MKKLLFTILALFSFFYLKAQCSPGAIIGHSRVCANDTTSLSDSTAGGRWSSSIPGVASINDTSGLVTGLTAGSTIISYTVCDSTTVTLNFTVNPLPNPGSIVGGYGSYCVGDTTTLTIVGASTDGTGTWISPYPAYGTVTSSGLVTFIGTGDFYLPIYYSFTDTLGCSDESEALLWFVGGPAAGEIRGADSVLLGTNTGLMEYGGYWSSLAWSSSSSSIATIDTSGVVTGISIGSATITCTVFTMCSSDYNTSTINVVSPIIGAVSTHFSAFVNRGCPLPQFGVSVSAHSATYQLVTFYGDGFIDTNAIAADTGTVLTTFYHTYAISGMYSIKQVLFNGATPVDSVSYSYRHFACRDIDLSFYIDFNGNCTYDTSSEHLNYLPLFVEIDSNSIPIDTFSVTSGLYYTEIGSSGDVYSFRLFDIDTQLTVSCLTSGILYDTLGSGTSIINNHFIALTCSSSSTGFNLVEKASMITGRHMSTGEININNYYCTPENAVVTMHVSPKYVFSSSIPSPTTIVGNTVTWDFSSLSATSLSSNILFTLVIPTSTWLTPGDTIHTSIIVTPTAGDIDTSNNYIYRVDTVKSSYDPNRVTGTPEGDILNGTKLQYAIIFENDGNDTAQNIYVMDTLSDNLDPYTLQVVGSSATMNIDILHFGSHNIVKFDFPNIKLLDSSYHDQCTGFVMYNIKARTGLADGTQILGHAGIYFDDNLVVLTDTAVNTILIPNLSIAALSGTDTICNGDTVRFTATFSTVNITHYKWYINSTLTGTDSSGFTLISAMGGDTVRCVMATIMDDTTYSTSNSIILINRGLPYPGAITGTTVSCVSETNTLTVASGATGGSWSSYHTSIATVSSSGVVRGIAVGSDIISYTVTNACGSNSATFAITVNPLPYAGTITGASSVCVGSSVTMADTAWGGSGDWSLSNSHATHSLGVISGVSYGIDTIIYTITTLCGSATTHKYLTIDSTVTPSVTITVTHDTVCAGDSVTFAPTPANGGFSPIFEWKKFSSIIGAGEIFSYIPSNGDYITCGLVSDAVCPLHDTVFSAPIVMVVNPAVTPRDSISTAIGDSISYLGQIVTFNSEVTFCGTGATYQWFLNGVLVPGATSNSYSSTVFNNDTIYCINTCNAACTTKFSDTSNTIVIYADYLSLENIHSLQTAFSRLSLSPNPNNGCFEFSGLLDAFSSSAVKFDVLDITGKIIYKGETIPKNGLVHEQVNLSGVASGQYILRVITENSVEFVHFVVER